MDGHLILEFQTEQEAETALHIINEIAAGYWISQGYTVIEENGTKQLVGKKNGVDNVEAVRTITWDDVKESPDGTFYIASPVLRFPDWRDYLPEGYQAPDDKVFPDSWNPEIPEE